MLFIALTSLKGGVFLFVFGFLFVLNGPKIDQVWICQLSGISLSLEHNAELRLISKLYFKLGLNVKENVVNYKS